MKAFYCAGTHWDREWYETFQEFRMWLVEQIDELMDLMDAEPEFKSFHLDGQAVVVEDYLTIRPEQRERLLGFLREGRILAGPWYVLPDEWLISGESYVRNLMKGMRTCRELGFEPMEFAYTPDQFGHIAALPMIAAGFGLKAGICWRGTQDETYPAHFVWIGPDGSRMVTHKLSDKGSYGPFMAARHPIEAEGFSDESFTKHFEPYFAEEKARSPIPLVLMLDAIDHQPAPRSMPRIMRELRRRYPEIKFVWGTLPQYAQQLLKHADALPERQGELREPCRDSRRGGQYLIVHTISARYPLKKRNDQCQALLEKWAEPYALFQMMRNGEPILRYLDVAWDYLLKNHPHDSICGCSIDQVHRDMLYRFDQCELIADGVIRRAVAAAGKASSRDEDLYNVVVHNPLPVARKGVVEIPVEFKPDCPSSFIDGLATAERINRFRLVKKDGTRLPFQISRIERGAAHKGVSEVGRRTTAQRDIYHLAVEMQLPSCGYTGFRVEPTDEANRTFGTQLHDALSACNEFLGFTLGADGFATLNSTNDKLLFLNMLLYEDRGDSGDGWTRGQLVNDMVCRSLGSRVMTAIEEDGPLRTVFRVEREFDLPARLERGTYTRSQERAVTRVTDRIYVEKGLPCIRVRTRIENASRDHRVRVLFSTHIEGSPLPSRSFAETPFALVERDIDIPQETATWHERVNPEKAFSTFFGIQYDSGGLAVLAPFGLHEYEVIHYPNRTIALTLFRSTQQTVGTGGEPDGQLLGTMEFEYLLYPFVGQFNPVEAARLVAQAQAGVRTHHAAELPEDASFVRLRNGKAVVTAIKPAANGTGGIIRLWNPSSEAVGETIILLRKPRTAERCNLNEEPRAALALDADGGISVTVPPRGLTTIRFTW